MTHPSRRLIVSLMTMLVAGCGDDSPNTARSGAATVPDAGPAADALVDAATSMDAAPEQDSAVDAAPWTRPGREVFDTPDCNAEAPPLILIHGMLEAGDAYAPHIRRFVANGHCAGRYYSFDWDPINRDVDPVPVLAALVDEVLATHGVEQVDLVGHSAGAGLAYGYAGDPARAATIRRYVHAGAFAPDAPPGSVEAPIPMLNLWSAGDAIAEGQDVVLDGISNVQLETEDHYAVITSEASFTAIYTFLYESAPTTTTALDSDSPWIAGRAVSLGENAPAADSRLTLWRLEGASGQRLEVTAQETLGDDGWWGPLEPTPDTYYEMMVDVPDRNVPDVRYFRRPFAGDDGFVYLRTFPSPGSLASILLSQIPTSDDRVSLVIFNARSAFLAGRDSVTLDGRELVDEEVASASDTAIALFVFDIDRDGAEGGQSALFEMFPFLSAIDLPLEPDSGESITLEFNGRKLRVPRAPASEGVLVAVFD